MLACWVRHLVVCVEWQENGCLLFPGEANSVLFPE